MTEEQKKRIEVIRRNYDLWRQAPPGNYSDPNKLKAQDFVLAIPILLEAIDSLTSRVKVIEEKHNIVCELNSALRQSQKSISEKNQALQSRLDRVEEAFIKAVEDEPELPGDMPDKMWEKFKDRDYTTEALRVTVKFTKEGILERFSKLSEAIRGKV